MVWRIAGAVILAAWLGGCAENRLSTGLMPPASEAPQPTAPAAGPADPSFRIGELKTGMTRAELIALFPNRMVAGSGSGADRYYYVEPPGVTTGTTVARDRLELLLNDDKLAAFGVVHANDEVMGATELGELPIVATAPLAPKARRGAKPTPAVNSVAPPAGKFAVQIGARRSEAEARALIDEMRAKYPVLLGQKWAEIHRVNLPQGAMYRVMVGPLATSQQAAQLCDGLKAQGVECFLRGT